MSVLIVSGNLQQYGDTGQYESQGEISPGISDPTIAGANWGPFNSHYNRSRDTSLATAGASSCKLQLVSGQETFLNSNIAILLVSGQCTIQPNKKYIVSAWVRTPSTNPIAPDTCNFRIFVQNSGITAIASSVSSILSAKDTWQQVSYKFSTDGLPSPQALDASVAITPNNFFSDKTNNLGIVNIDQFEIYEYQEVTGTPLDFDLPGCVVTDDSGASDGTITVAAVGGTAPYQYSINGGAYGGSNVFSGLAVSAIPYIINIKDNVGAIVSHGFTVNLSGALHEQYNDTPICIITLDQDYPTYDMVSGDKIYCFCAPDNYTIVVQRYSGGNFYTITQGPAINELISSNLVENVYPFDPQGGKPKPGRYAPDQWKSYLQFCDINTPGRLIFFTGTYNYPIFPYAQAGLQNNSPSCTAFVCDLFWLNDQNNPKLTAPTNQYTNDGQIKVSAVSSKAPIRFSLNEDMDYTMMSNTSGIFSGLAPGNYTVSARDTNNCKQSLQVVLKVDPVYNPKFRLESHDIVNSVEARVDICERDYVGEVIDIDGGEDPVVLSKPQTDLQNKFEVLRPTFATLTLANKKNFQFISLFSQDDRKYLVKYYKPVGTLIWSGFIIPSVFSESMAITTYFTEIKCTDNIEELSSIPFLDGTSYQGNAALLQYVGGNLFTGNFSLVQIVCLVLAKLNLNLNVRFAINMLEQSYSINPTEAYIDALSFYDYSNNTVWNCDKVLQTVLAPFGAFVIQDDGVWNVVRLEEQCAPYDYKEYDSTGVYIGTGTNDKVIEIKDPSLRMGAVFTDIDQSTLEINPAYGIIDLQYTLNAKPSLLFDSDFNPLNFDGTNFKGWIIDRNHQTNVKVKCEQIVVDNLADQINKAIGQNKFSVTFGSFALTLENLDSLTSPNSDPTQPHTHDPTVSVPLDLVSGNQYVIIKSRSQAIEYTNDSIDFSFDYRFNLNDLKISPSGIATPIPSFNPWFIKLKFEIRLNSGKYYNITSQAWQTTQLWNTIVVDKFDQDQNFKASIILPPSTILVTDLIQISFKICGVYFVDAFNLSAASGGTHQPVISEIKNIETIDLPVGSSIISLGEDYLQGAGLCQKYWTLKQGDNSDDDLFIRPLDYNVTTNPVYWELYGLSTFDNGGGTGYAFVVRKQTDLNTVNKFYLDNVIVKFRPLFSDVPVLEDIGLINNQNYKENLQIQLNAGDLPTDKIDSARYIYYNYFRTAAGQPTGHWNRVGINENNTLQQILVKQLARQYSNPSYKISGDLRGYTNLGFLTIIKHTQPAPDITLVNPELNGSGLVNTGWQNYGAGTKSWANNANRGYVALTSGDSLSQIYAQTANIDIGVGERIAIDIYCEANISGIRVDELHVCLLDSDANILQDVKVSAFSSTGTITKRVSFNVQQDAVNIGFYVTRVMDGGGSSNYAVDYFRLTPLSVVRYYMFNMVDISHRKNSYNSELVQIIPMLSGSDPAIDDSGNNSGNPPSGSVGAFSGAYSSAFGSSFNSVLS